MIPHTIHYIWFGGGAKPKNFSRYLASWKKFFPGWEIIEWNESNYDIDRFAYVREAYDAKMYAFASDCARFDILFEYGGIYMDTDVEVLKPFPEEILKLPGFTGEEDTAPPQIAPGLIWACEKGDSMTGEVLGTYRNDHFLMDKNSDVRTICNRATDIFAAKGYIQEGGIQTIEKITVFPSEYFCAYNWDLALPEITDKSLTIHHYDYTWGGKWYQFKRMFIKMFGVNVFLSIRGAYRRLEKKIKR